MHFARRQAVPNRAFQLGLVTPSGTAKHSDQLTSALQAPADCDGVPVDLEVRAGAPLHTKCPDCVGAAAQPLCRDCATH